MRSILRLSMIVAPSLGAGGKNEPLIALMSRIQRRERIPSDPFSMHPSRLFSRLISGDDSHSESFVRRYYSR
jgi:hypothetical protein